MQQHPGMIPVMPSVPSPNITTEQIQKFLDENKTLISAIMENQNQGKLHECAHYQALLQKNLMYLAAIADAQPQTSAAPPQVAPHPSMSPGGYYMQHPQSTPSPQQPGAFPRMPLHFNNPPYQSHEQQQQAMQGQMGNIRSGIPSNGGTPPSSTAVHKERHPMEVGPSNADGIGIQGTRPRGGEASNER